VADSKGSAFGAGFAQMQGIPFAKSAGEEIKQSGGLFYPENPRRGVSDAPHSGA